ncbi:Dapdiamide synthesis protein DdaC [Micromonospora noduli]|uniref:Dapdiamide synthesis protein DdaC n=1 Tax=Micromonospora noduli TaxID=709876 RepID=A0A328NDQ6_9ACTN|nr:TauD/TfdA family dioxygenase [Micromonospora noduli]RAO04202.1 Dapdiamide synthesis protein DdaC [Micromonospora noduli]RAO25340.1 Dapdiamide synthesis protein DdaC [Micromonospora noduli]RAO32712.1 Dapdiamide synthesis protein DdaC [Micromonospora noduli]RAO53894.1 Dapdiamide synthesis protein DdaC [Micromonospora noduli]
MSTSRVGSGPRRRSDRTTRLTPVRRSPLHDTFGLLFEAREPDLDLAAFLDGNQPQVLADLDLHGAILFRGFAVNSPGEFGDAARALSPELLKYLERAAPRNEVADGVFTSTELAADRWIELHHEMSYAHSWPSRLYFYCEVAADQGGATPLASERTVVPAIPTEIRERFLRHGVCYVRNYGPDLDLPWQEVFQTVDRTVVEAYCRASGAEFTWTGRDALRTRSVRQAMAHHPRTGEAVWFNHAHLFHVAAMAPEVAATLVNEVGIEGLPRNAYYGDGQAIDDEVITLIRSLYQESAMTFSWQRGDVLVADNFLVTHGREPFTGDRRVLVAMSDLYVTQESS